MWNIVYKLRLSDEIRAYQSNFSATPVDDMWDFSIGKWSTRFIVNNIWHQPRKIRFFNPLIQDIYAKIEIVVAKNSAANVEFVQHRNHLFAFSKCAHWNKNKNEWLLRSWLKFACSWLICVHGTVQDKS